MSDTFTVITTMKNKGAFLLEWVAHHKARGFDHLVICTTDCADPTREMALRLQETVLVRHHASHHWEVTSIQRAALKQASRSDEMQKADRIYVCDADEFLVVRLGDGSARATVAADGPQVEVISVPWRIFGPDGRVAYEDLPVSQQFVRANARIPMGSGAIAHPKSLFRGMDNVRRVGVHARLQRPGLERGLRRERPAGVPDVPQRHVMFVSADYRFAQVNHYALRSLESLLVKQDRGRVNHMGQLMEKDCWARFDIAQETCTAIRRFDAPASDWIQRLMEDPALAALHRQAVAWHCGRIAELRGDPGYLGKIDAIRIGAAA